VICPEGPTTKSAMTKVFSVLCPPLIKQDPVEVTDFVPSQRPAKSLSVKLAIEKSLSSVSALQMNGIGTLSREKNRIVRANFSINTVTNVFW
jgi:hypothetical protein